MLRLIALAPEDGWACIETDKGTFLLRPPYVRDSLVPISGSTVENCVSAHGFLSEDVTFSDWQGLVRHLRQRIEECRPDRRAVSTRELGNKFFASASPDDLDAALNYVENELLPQQSWSHAQAILTAVLRIPLVRQNDSLYDRATRLLEDVTRQQQEHARQKLLGSSVPDESVSPLADLKYGAKSLYEYARGVGARRTMFTFA